MGCLGSIHHYLNENRIEQAASLFLPFWGAKAPIFCMRWAPSAVAYHSGSDTFIINYMAAWWHQTLAWGMQWAVQGVLRCLAAQGTILITTRVSFKSISITHWPFSLLYFIWGDGWRRWLAACMQHIYGTAEITSRDLALSLSHRIDEWKGAHHFCCPPLILPIETTGDAETTISLDDDKPCWTTPWRIASDTGDIWFSLYLYSVSVPLCM